MSDPYIGEIRAFGFNFEPRGWAYCDGRLVSIAQNTALFSLLGVMYGGDGRTTFALPDLRSRSIVGQGNGPGLRSRVMGESYGQENVTLQQSNMPAHTHVASGTSKAANVRASSNRPEGAIPATGGSYAAESAATGTGAPLTVTLGQAGGSQAFDNTTPSLVANYCIALVGIFPSRN